MDPDVAQKAQMLRKAFDRDAEAEFADALALVCSWGHSTRGGGLHRMLGFEDKRGAVVGRLVEGPAEPPGAGTEEYGLDADKRIVFVRRYGSGGGVWTQTAIRRGPEGSLGVTWANDGSLPWTPEFAYLEVENEGRVVSTTMLSCYGDGVSQTRFIYDDERLVEEIHVRERPFEDGTHEQRSVMLYDARGKPEALVTDGHVEWRRRAGSRERNSAIAAVEAGLVRDLAEAIRPVGTDRRQLVWIRHQDDGGWTDQLGPTVSMHPVSDPPAQPPSETWDADWDAPHVDVELAQTTAEAIAALEALETPGDHDARRLLKRVALQLSGRSDLGHPIVVVSHFDSANLRRQLRRSLSTSDLETITGTWL